MSMTFNETPPSIATEDVEALNLLRLDVLSYLHEARHTRSELQPFEGRMVVSKMNGTAGEGWSLSVATHTLERTWTGGTLKEAIKTARNTVDGWIETFTAKGAAPSSRTLRHQPCPLSPADFDPFLELETNVLRIAQQDEGQELRGIWLLPGLDEVEQGGSLRFLRKWYYEDHPVTADAIDGVVALAEREGNHVARHLDEHAHRELNDGRWQAVEECARRIAAKIDENLDLDATEVSVFHAATSHALANPDRYVRLLPNEAINMICGAERDPEKAKDVLCWIEEHAKTHVHAAEVVLKTWPKGDRTPRTPERDKRWQGDSMKEACAKAQANILLDVGLKSGLGESRRPSRTR